MRRYLLSRTAAAMRRIEKVLVRTRVHLETKVNWCDLNTKRLLQSNAALQYRHRGARAFVIGTGPSIATQNLMPLGSEVTYTMSGFWKHEATSSWQPTYYCFADPLFFDGSAAMGRFFRKLQERVHDTTYILPNTASAAVARKELISGSKIHYVSLQGRLADTVVSRIDFTQPIPGVMSVAQLAIMSAIYMGCSPIVLLGLDHDWLSKRGMDRHFYSGKTIEGHSEAHGNLDQIPYKTDLQNVLWLWEGYEALARIARNHGCEIVNATAGGFLDVYPRVKYEEMIRT